MSMKLASYALANRDLRDAFLENYPVEPLYVQAPYPHNLTIGNLMYFWWAPTLVYQPVYPRSSTFRPWFLLKRISEVVGGTFVLCFLTSQYMGFV